MKFKFEMRFFLKHTLSLFLLTLIIIIIKYKVILFFSIEMESQLVQTNIVRPFRYHENQVSYSSSNLLIYQYECYNIKTKIFNLGILITR